MTIQDQQDGGGSDPGPPGAGAGVRNAVTAVSGTVVQAHTVGTVAVHPARSRWPVPRQLPPAPHGFVGRADHLADLDRPRTAPDEEVEQRAVISVIGGAGGVGKTWLALTWAYRNLHRFPDGQLFADLRGFDPTGRSADPADVLDGFLDALGVEPAHRPADPDRRAALFRSLVADKGVLVVLDNAAGADQVVPLLPGGRCAVLVTSRNHLHGLVARHGARPVRPGAFTGAESRALLSAALGPDRVAVEERAVAALAASCGGFPLALGLVAARAAAEPRLPLADAVAELRDLGLAALDSEDPLSSLPAVLSWSLRHLTDRQRRVFALLGIAPGPDIGLPAAACLTGLPEREAHAVLRALVESSLVERTPGGRYGMHDLVRGYATSVAADLPEQVRESALRRVLDFYTRTACAAAGLLDPHATPIPPDPGPAGRVPATAAAALDWFDTEHPCLPAAQRLAADHGWHRAAWHLAWATTLVHYQRGHRRVGLAVRRAGVVAARRLGDPVAHARALRYLGHACRDLGLHREAAEHLDRSLSVAEHAGDPVNQSHTHRALALLRAESGDDRHALEHATHALRLHRDLDNPVQRARTLNTTAWIAARLGRHDEARAHCEAALVLQRRHHDTGGEADTLVNLGYVEHRGGHHHRAVEHYSQALAWLRAYGSTYATAYALDGLGLPYAALGRPERARAVWQEALELYRAQGRDADAARVRRLLDGV